MPLRFLQRHRSPAAKEAMQMRLRLRTTTISASAEHRFETYRQSPARDTASGSSRRPGLSACPARSCEQFRQYLGGGAAKSRHGTRAASAVGAGLTSITRAPRASARQGRLAAGSTSSEAPNRDQHLAAIHRVPGRLDGVHRQRLAEPDHVGPQQGAATGTARHRPRAQARSPPGRRVPHRDRSAPTRHSRRTPGRWSATQRRKPLPHRRRM
jgi:hypothetical protein